MPRPPIPKLSPPPPRSWLRIGSRLSRRWAPLALALLAGGAGAAGSLASRFVRAHNAVRAQASPRPSLPLPTLSWSDALASTAQAWANQCRYEHSPRLRELGHGQNIAAMAPPGRKTPEDVVSLWASEARDYDRAANACRAGRVCGHYTQIVWRATLHVGCARAVCDRGSPQPGLSRWELWVCDYEPAGNFVGQRPY